MATILTSAPVLAALRARLAGDPAERPVWDDSACPRCESAGACPQWCVDADEEEEEPSPCDLGDHDMVEVDYDAPVSSQQCRACGHTEDVDVTADIEAACVEAREQWLYGADR